MSRAGAVSAALLTALMSLPATAATEKAIFAGGCFWCTESDFEKVPGVISAVSGYTGGHTEQPTYEQSNTGRTGHTEAVEVTFDPAKLSYPQLVKYFWRTIDPLDARGQFCDKGPQYRSGIFPIGDEQMAAAIASKREAEAALGKTVVTEITPATRFWPAEDYHQNYYKENSLRYGYYRYRCGRDDRVKALWGDEAWFLIPKG